MTDHSPEAIERIAAAPWCYASEDISAALRALMAERDHNKTQAKTADDACRVWMLTAQLADQRAQDEAEASAVAVLAERERCAQLVSSSDHLWPDDARLLADELREEPTP